MKYEFSHFDPSAFERLCAALLAAEGYHVRQFARSGGPDYGIDFVFESERVACIVQVKLIRNDRMPISTLRSAIFDLQRSLIMMKAQRALLIVSVPVSIRVREQLPHAREVEIWDATRLESLLDRHPQVRQAYAAYITSSETLDSLLKALEAKAPTVEDIGAALLAELESVPSGTKSWKKYEDICVKILNHAFVPPLRMPRVQSRSHDGLDRRDAVYPIGSGQAFWDSIKYQHSARIVVAEFKNHANPIGQKEVESLQQYLMPDAMRSFGIICSRKPPSKPALKARRRAWMTSKNLILFLSDLDLQELVRTRTDGGDTSRILESQMEDFFITLAP
ncbi:MAG TPA: restriction endonuclease [Bryobacteraceae bacterium]